MSLNDPLANALSKILNAEKSARGEVSVKPASKMLKNVLEIMKDQGYIGEFTEVNDGKGGFVKINLLGKINNCGVIKPRFIIQKDGYEKYEKRFLPAKDFGIIIISTNKGLLLHDKGKELNIGGRLIAYCY